MQRSNSYDDSEYVTIVHERSKNSTDGLFHDVEEQDVSFIKCKWSPKKLKQYLSYPQFYRDVEVKLDLVHLQKDTPGISCNFKFCKTVSAMGSVAEFDRTNSSSFSILNFDETISDPMGIQGPVSLDEKIHDLLSDADFDFVVHLSTMTKLMDTANWEPCFDIPVVIRNHDSGSTTKKIIFLDKTIILPFITIEELKEHRVKNIIKRTYCCSVSKKVCTEGISNVFAPRHEVSDVEGLEDSSAPLVNETRHFDKNTVYNLWNMSTSESADDPNKPKETKILIRCKLDAYNDEEKRAVSYFPTIDTSPINSKQLIRRWNSIFFRPNSLLYDLQVVASKFALDLERPQVDELSEIAEQAFKFKPERKFLVVSKIFEELKKHEAGNYLLHYKDCNSHISLLKELTLDDIPDFGNIFDLHEEYDYKGIYIVA